MGPAPRLYARRLDNAEKRAEIFTSYQWFAYSRISLKVIFWNRVLSLTFNNTLKEMAIPIVIGIRENGVLRGCVIENILRNEMLSPMSNGIP
jgi:hypothetical protein